MPRQVVEKKLPLFHAPHMSIFAVAIKPGREGGNPIELAVEIGQRFEWLDRPHFSRKSANSSMSRPVTEWPNCFAMKRKKPPPQPRSRISLGGERCRPKSWI